MRCKRVPWLSVLSVGSVALLSADALAAAVEGPVTEACPASVLQLHPDATVVVDRDAATGLHRIGRRHASIGGDWLD